MLNDDKKWENAPKCLRLKSDEIHVWRVSLNQSLINNCQPMKILSIDEKIRANRFLSEKTRNKFIICRYSLRTILSRYLSIAPDCLKFCYGPYGKPALIENPGKSKIFFNISHSNELALFAISYHEIGIDIEKIRTIKGLEQIAEKCFTTRENIILSNSPADKKEITFLKFWVGKEAFIKAKGKSLSTNLKEFDIPVFSRQPVKHNYNLVDVNKWFLYEINPSPGYIAALIAEGKFNQLRYWQI